jgi:hypothetical protein
MTDARIICPDHGVVQNIFGIDNMGWKNMGWIEILELHCPQCGSKIQVEYVDHIPIAPCAENASCPLPHAVKAAKKKEIEYYRSKYWPDLKEEKNGNESNM